LNETGSFLIVNILALMYVIARLESPGEDEARMSSGPVINLSVAKKK